MSMVRGVSSIEILIQPDDWIRLPLPIKRFAQQDALEKDSSSSELLRLKFGREQQNACAHLCEILDSFSVRHAMYIVMEGTR